MHRPLTLSPILLLAAAATAQTSWIPGPSLPEFLDGHPQAYDEARGLTVVFGGCAGGSGCTSRDWTLVYDGNQWTELAPAVRPSARFWHAMAYDRARGNVVLFGGVGATGTTNDTWTWDGQTWSQVATAMAPSPRGNAAMVYDSARARIVLVGGGGVTARTETWTFDGTSWQLETPLQLPPALFNHWMAYDEARDRVVVVSRSSATLAEVYEFDGTTWHTIPTPGARPATAQGAGLAYDALRGVCVFVAGTLSTGTRAWEWDGGAWTARGGAIGAMIADGALSFDRARGRMVHSGGSVCDFIECSPYGGVDEYVVDDPASANPFGEGCAGSTTPLRLTATLPNLPWLGDELELVLSPAPGNPAVHVGFVGTSRTFLRSVPLPLPLGVLGRPDCLLFTSSELAVPLQASGGTADWVIPIPKESAFLGVSFYLQALTLGDPVASVVATSNGVQAMVGAK